MKGNGAAFGDYALTILGKSFGTTDQMGKARVGTSCLANTWVSDSTVLCKAAGGLGNQIPVVFTVAENISPVRPSTATKAFSYDVAQVFSWVFFEVGPLYPYNQPAATGGSSISVRGINFGTADFSIRSRIGNTATQGCRWISDSVITVKVAAGVGAELTHVLFTPSGTGTVSKFFAYGKPVITGRALGTTLAPLTSPFNGPTAGNTQTSFTGFNFGRVDYTGKASLGGTAINRVLTNWVSDSQVSIRTPPGGCAAAGVSFTVGGQVDTHTKAFTFDAPEIFASPHAAVNVSAINSPVTGGKTVSILGINFGTYRFSGKGKYGDTSGEASKWVSDSTTSFKSPAGVSSSLTAVFSVCQRAGEVKLQLSYDAPAVTDQTPSNGRTDGGSQITLFGMNFGTADYTSRASLGTHTNKTLVYLDGAGGLSPYNISGGTICEGSKWLSDTSAACKVAAGAGVEYGVSFTVGVNVGTQQSGHFYSYDKPTMTGVSPSNGPAYGGENVTLSYGGKLTTYSVTMLGRDFGKADYSPKARLGDTDCMAASWLSHSSIVCKIPGGACRDVSISVTLQGRDNGTQYGVTTKVFSYDAPSLSNIGNNTGPTSGGSDFRINGKNFGPNAPGYSVEYRIGSTQMNQTTWISDTYITGKIPAGVCKKLTLGVLVCDQEGTLSQVFSYFSPNLTGASGGETNLMTFKGERTGAALDPAPSIPILVQTGGSTVSVTGAYFGTADYTGNVRFGGTSGFSTNWTSDTAVEATSPPGVCSGQSIVYTVCDQPGTLEGAFCYDNPFVTSGTIRWPNRPTTGGSTISMLGINFGTAHYSPAGRLYWTELESEWTSADPAGLKNYSGTGCMASNWISFSSVSCKIPAGIYPDQIVRFTVCAEAGSSNNVTTFSYDEPTILSVKSGNSPATGKASLTVSGINFGTADYSGKMFVGPPTSGFTAANASHTAFMISTWISDTSILAQTPAGLGTELGLILFHNVTGRPAGTLDSLFSYDGPTLSSVALANGPTSGALNITITGVNYGTEDYFSLQSILGMLRSGGTASHSTYWISDSQMLGLLSPGICPHRPLVVSVLTQVGTASAIFSYDQPLFYWNTATSMFSGPLVDNGDGASYSPNAPTASTQNVNISGNNFGANDYTVKTRIGKTSVQMMKWLSETAVVGMVAPGVCHSLNVSMIVCDQVGTGSQVFTYNNPVLVMNGTNAATTGKQALTLNGVNFGSHDYSVSGGIGFSEGETTMWISDTTVHVQVAAGIRGMLVMVATACEQVGTQKNTYSYFTYNSPAVSSMNGNAPSTGGTTISVAGANFGTAGYTGTARLGTSLDNSTVFGATRSEATDWVSDTAVKTKTPAGVAHLLGVTFTVGRLMGTSSGHFTYDVPKPSAISFSNRATSGTASVTIFGANFGSAGYSPHAHIGFTAVMANNWISTSAILVKVPAGVCSGLSVVVTVGDTVFDAGAYKGGPIIDHVAYGTAVALFSYDAPAVMGTIGTPSAASTGGSSVTVQAANMGTRDVSMKARVGHTASEAMKWTSDTEMTLKIAEGCGIMKDVVVTVCGHRGSGTRIVSYNPPMVSSVSTPNAPTTGGSTFTMTGTHFHSNIMSGKASVGLSSAAKTMWLSHSSVTASPIAGVCTTSISFTVCDQVGTLTSVFTFDQPSLKTFAGTNAPKLGGSSTTTYGANFAIFDLSGASRIGGTAAQSTLWKSNTAVVLKSAQGYDGSLRIVFTACGAMGTTTASFTFDLPVIIKGTPVHGPAAGGTITMHGQDFGIADYSGKARFNGTVCETTVWTSNSVVSCKYPAGTGGYVFTVFSMAVKKATLTHVFTFDDPSITSLQGTNSVATGGMTLSMYGENFGTNDYTVITKVGATACARTIWVSDSYVGCRTSGGVCKDRDISVQVGGNTGSFSKGFSYDKPSIKSVDVKHGPGTGGNTVSVSGMNFGTSLYSAVVSVVGDYVIKAELSRWVSDTMLMVKMPMGGGVNLDVTAVICELRATLTKAYSYDAPTISAFKSVERIWPLKESRGNGPQGVGSTLTVLGQNLGAIDLTLKSKIGGTSTITSHWISDSSMSMQTAPGMGNSEFVNVYLEDTTGIVYMATLTEAFSFDSPVITAITPHSVVSGSTITVRGSGMGVYDASPTFKVGGTACEAAVWVSVSQVLCKTPGGVGGLHDVEGEFAEYVFSKSGVFTYSYPVVTATVLPNGPQTGGTMVTVLGAGFGTWDTSPTAKAGDTACVSSTWYSASSINCLLHPGTGVTDVVVEETSTGQTFSGRKTQAFQYDGPRATAVTPATTPQLGGATLTITGSNFGTFNHPNPTKALKSKVGDTDCRSTTWISASSATCVTPASLCTQSLTLDLAGTANSMLNAIVYDGFCVKSISPLNGPTAGGSAVAVVGDALGTAAAPPSVSFGLVSAQVSWISATALSVTLPASVNTFGGTDISIQGAGVTTGPQVLSGIFSYDAATITDLKPSRGELVGGNRVTVTGTNFGGAASAFTFLIGGQNCTGLMYVSDTRCTCSAPASPKYTTVSVRYVHAGVTMMSVQQLTTYPDYFFDKTSAYEYKVYTGPATLFTTKETVAPGKTVMLQVDGGGVSVPAGAFGESTVELTLSIITAFEGAEPAGNDKFASSLLSFKTEDENGNYLAPSLPIPMTIPVLDLFSRRNMQQISHLMAGSSHTQNVESMRTTAAMLRNLTAAGPPSQRRKLLATTDSVRTSWLDKCTGFWKPICETKYNFNILSVEGDIPASVFAEPCFNPVTGCTTAILAAQQCEGAGGTFTAMAFDKDPCPDDSGSSNSNNVALIIGCVLGGLGIAILIGAYVLRMRKLADSDGDSSYESSKYSDDEEIGSEYGSLYMSQASPSGSFQSSPRMIMPGSYVNPGMGQVAPPSSYNHGTIGSYVAPQTPYGQYSTSAGPMVQHGGQNGSYDNVGGMGSIHMGMGDMALPPPVFAQGMGGGAMAVGLPQGYYPRPMGGSPGYQQPQDARYQFGEREL